MNFFNAIKICLTTKYTDFHGRSSRAEFWWFLFFCVLIGAFFRLSIYYCIYLKLEAVAIILSAFHVLVNIFLLLPSWGVQIRRLHDTGRSSAWFWAFFISLNAYNMIQIKWSLYDFSFIPSLVSSPYVAAVSAQIFFDVPLTSFIEVCTFLLYLDGYQAFYIMLPCVIILPAMLGLVRCLMLKGTDTANGYGPAPGSGVQGDLPLSGRVMDFPSALKNCLLRRYAGFQGRASRAEYWYFTFGYLLFISFLFSLFLMFKMLAFSYPSSFVHALYSSVLNMTDGVPVLLLFIPFAFLLLPNLAVLVRRLHDTGRSGLWGVAYVLLQIITFVFYYRLLILWGLYSIGLLLLTLLRGTPGDNEYGPDPLAEDGRMKAPVS